MPLARIYEAFPLGCSRCGAEMRIIAFITDPPTMHGLRRRRGLSAPRRDP